MYGYFTHLQLCLVPSLSAGLAVCLPKFQPSSRMMKKGGLIDIECGLELQPLCDPACHRLVLVSAVSLRSSKPSPARLPLICCANGSCGPKNEAKTRNHTGCDFSTDLSEKLFNGTQPASRCLWISLNTEMFCAALTFNLCSRLWWSIGCQIC